ncbi:MAG: hypothetical protein QOD74_2232 [Variibacter sp.]|jgi:hypothetical protein|nr:hypothetical protein [Variibacter sp.]
MIKAAVWAACVVGALLTVDHVVARNAADHSASGKGDRLPAAAPFANAPQAIPLSAGGNTTIVIRRQGPDQFARDMSKRPGQPASPMTPAKSPTKKLPHACEPSVSPLASATTIGARCVT